MYTVKTVLDAHNSMTVT